MKMLTLAALAAILAAPVAARADIPGKHPAYLHALTDLRHARAHLEKPARPEVKWDEMRAIHKIDDAINEIKRAAIDDGKDIGDHPPVDEHLDHRGRLHRSLELLRKARRDIEEHEDNGYNNGLRDRAIHHIDGAIDVIKEALHE